MRFLTKGFGFSLVLILCTVLGLRTALAGMPLTTDDAYTVEKGVFQLETGIDFTRQENHDKELSPSVTLSYGLFERMDVGAGSAYLFVHPAKGKKENGLGDTEVKVKYHLINQKGWWPHFAVSCKLKIPTASESKGLGSGKADFTINTIFTWNLGEQWQLHSNLGYTFIGEHHVDNEFNYSLAAQLTLSEKWALVGEIVGVNNFNGHKRDDPVSVLVGAQYMVSDNFVFDAGIESGMNRAAPDYRLTVGLTFLFKP